MAFKIDGDKRAGGEGNDFGRIEDGTYPARFVQLIDVGEQENTDYKTGEALGTYSRKLFLTYEFPTERIEVKGEDKPRWLSENQKFSMSEKANLPKRLKALGTGKEKTIEDMLGNPCMVEVSSTSGGKAKVANVSKPMKGMQVGALENTARAFDMDDANMEVWDELPNFMKEMIQNARNFRGSDIEQKLIERGDDVESDDGPGNDAAGEPDFDDDVPFDDE